LRFNSCTSRKKNGEHKEQQPERGKSKQALSIFHHDFLELTFTAGMMAEMYLIPTPILSLMLRVYVRGCFEVFPQPMPSVL